MLASGQVIGTRYRLVRPLGAGGMGSVWVAEHLSMGSWVALKVIAPELAHHPIALARFKREAQAAAALRSPHVVQVLDYDVDPNVGPFLIMELLEGEDLSMRLRRYGRLSAAVLAPLLLQVGKALARAHAADVVHRDLKPENIFIIPDIDGTELVKVLDFGVAKAAIPLNAWGEGTAAGTLIGTLPRMSPEQAQGKEVDHRSDLWSLGVVAFEALVGHPPFALDLPAGQLILQICALPLPVPSQCCDQVPEGFDAWFARCTQRDRSKRFQSALEQTQAFAQMVGQPFTSTPAKRKRPVLQLVPSIAPECTEPNPPSKPVSAQPDGYYVREGTLSVGPVSATQLWQGYRLGKVSSEALVWTRPWSAWRSITEVLAMLPSEDPRRSEKPLAEGDLKPFSQSSIPPRDAPLVETPCPKRSLPTLPAPASWQNLEPASKPPVLSKPSAPQEQGFYVTDGGLTVGPVQSSVLKRGLQEQRLPSSALVWRPGWDRWRSIDQTEEELRNCSLAPVEKLTDSPGLQALGAPQVASVPIPSHLLATMLPPKQWRLL